MKKLLAAAATTGLLGVGAIASATPAGAATTAQCSVYQVKSNASGPAWQASCPSSIGYASFRLRVTCLRVQNTYAYLSYGAWARSGSGTSTAGCSAGYIVTAYSLSLSS